MHTDAAGQPTDCNRSHGSLPHMRASSRPAIPPPCCCNFFLTNLATVRSLEWTGSVYRWLSLARPFRMMLRRNDNHKVFTSRFKGNFPSRMQLPHRSIFNDNTKAAMPVCTSGPTATNLRAEAVSHAPAAYFSAALFFHSASALLASPLNFGRSTFKAALFG